MKEEDIRLIKQEIKNNRKAGECGLASNNEKFEWTKTADALEKLLDYITNLQEENERLKKKDKTRNAFKEFVTNEYKLRINKAIEKLKDLYSYADNEEYVDNYCKVLLNILQNNEELKGE